MKPLTMLLLGMVLAMLLLTGCAFVRGFTGQPPPAPPTLRPEPPEGSDASVLKARAVQVRQIQESWER